MLDSVKDSTELEKRIQNHQNFDSFLLTKKILVRLQEIIMSLTTDETTEVIRKFEKMYTTVDTWTDIVLYKWCEWKYRMALFKQIDSERYLFRIETRVEISDGSHKNMVANYPLTGRKRYDIFRSDLHALIRNTRISEYETAKAWVFHNLSRELHQVSLKELLFHDN